ncbi:MAG: LysR family transcriptional regulator [Myxococcota bacterium]|nr:LysR family transcriptional regulator [Myxococcota bacterium]
MADKRARSRLRVTLYLGEAGHKLGPGKVRLLEAIEREGSIAAAARSMGMAYRHAWEMVDELNHSFDTPVARVRAGGSAGGGAGLTEFGAELVARFRRIEAEAQRGAGREIDALAARVVPGEPARRHRASG